MGQNKMKYGSVCSGIEAASVAWESLGWEAQWFSEIEHFPSAVLAHRFPTVPNLGDMTKIHESETFNNATINLLVGGTPCQSFSVAGLRKGLDDPRGNLMLTFLSLAERKKPRWIVWENVPGVLSSNGGRDFATFLTALGDIGYGFAYRVLDAQYFGVAQRRRRVFVVGYLGDHRPAAAVLFEQDCLSGHTKKSREKRKTTSSDAKGSFGGSGIPRVSGSLDTECGGGKLTHQSVNNGHLVPVGFRMTAFGEYADDNSASTLKQRDYKDATDLVTHAFKVRGGSETETGEQGGTPGKKAGKGYLGSDELAFTIGTTQDQQIAQPIAYSFDSLSSNSMKSSNPNSGCREVETSSTIDATTPTPSKNQGGIAIAQPIALAENTIGRQPMNGGNGDGFTEKGPMYTLNATGVHGVAQPIAFTTEQTPKYNENQALTLTKSESKHNQCVAQPIAFENHAQDSRVKEMGDTCTTVTSNYGMGGGNTPLVAQPIAVDCYNQTINEKTTQTIGSSASDVNHYGAVLQPVYNVTKEVKIRKHIVDIEALKDLLKTHKTLSNKVIAEKLNVPKTKVDHWFRSDNCFAIPDPENWMELKQLLKIKNDSFDQSIMEFIIDENKFDSSNRIFDANFPSPTLTSASSDNSLYLVPTIIDRAAFNQGANAQYDIKIEEGQTMPSLVARGPHGVGQYNPPTMAIRRLTPKECERLQGFPDDWTLIPYRNKSVEQCPDGPRYKACGNSMAVPVMRWIGQRIEMVEKLIADQ
jgi:DNA-cytosine methyltransferase